MSVQELIAETFRYLGVGNAVPDESLTALAEQAIRRVSQAAKTRYLIQRLPCRIEEDTVVLGGLIVRSADLARHLSGCNESFLFAATLGANVDRLLRRDTLTQPSLAVVEQAAATAVLEAYCDEVCCSLESTLSAKYLRPRFSAGYGDMPLDTQETVLRMLEAPKQIGLSCTRTNMLTPMKSVTAVIGIADEQTVCFSKGCDMCRKTDCAFRRI
ncbi:MAG: Vitamin B12 dependent methionine synthase activation subunit [Ruminococcaceae bacterium]|nr:Vitamin B12 dependent methionine synthase activation subunit [Oscillospiraceae bacterium]